MAITAVKELPILFSSPMVRALLDGRKTQTRRIVKPQPVADGVFWIIDSPKPFTYDGGSVASRLTTNSRVSISEALLSISRFKVGMRLWVRETVCLLERDHWWDSGKPRDWLYSVKNPRRNGCAYRAETDSEGDDIRKEYGYKWTPSILMPRWASRLTLEITEVRVQRVREITLKDVAEEGAPPTHVADNVWDSTETFSALWNKINGKGSWESNPWVWCISFNRVTQEPRP